RIHRKEVHQLLRRLVEAAAPEVTAGVREVQSLAPVRVPAAGFSVAHRGLEREDRLFSVLVGLEPGPDMIEARFQVVDIRLAYGPERRDGRVPQRRGQGRAV